MQNKLSQIEIKSRFSKRTLAYTDKNCACLIYKVFLQFLKNIPQTLYPDKDFGIKPEEIVYVTDGSKNDLYFLLSPCVCFRKSRHPTKLHTLQDPSGNIPTCIFITGRRFFDIKIFYQFVLKTEFVCMMGRGYGDFVRLYLLSQCIAFFLILFKKNEKVQVTLLP